MSETRTWPVREPDRPVRERDKKKPVPFTKGSTGVHCGPHARGPVPPASRAFGARGRGHGPTSVGPTVDPLTPECPALEWGIVDPIANRTLQFANGMVPFANGSSSGFGPDVCRTGLRWGGGLGPGVHCGPHSLGPVPRKMLGRVRRQGTGPRAWGPQWTPRDPLTRNPVKQAWAVSARKQHILYCTICPGEPRQWTSSQRWRRCTRWLVAPCWCWSIWSLRVATSGIECHVTPPKVNDCIVAITPAIGDSLRPTSNNPWSIRASWIERLLMEFDDQFRSVSVLSNGGGGFEIIVTFIFACNKLHIWWRDTKQRLINRFYSFAMHNWPDYCTCSQSMSANLFIFKTTEDAQLVCTS